MKHTVNLHSVGGDIAQLVKALGLVNPLTAITFSCAAIIFPTVYNLQHHQWPVSLITSLYGVGG